MPTTATSYDSPNGLFKERAATIEYNRAEECLGELIKAHQLDEHVKNRPPTVRILERTLDNAVALAYGVDEQNVNRHDAHSMELAHLFLQRVLYRINRLKLFWFDDLKSYDNEQSSYLNAIRSRIESAWQLWERAFLNIPPLNAQEARQELRRRSAYDVLSRPSPSSLFFRNECTEPGYRRLIAITSLDGMVEASQLSRTLGGVSNDIHSIMTRLLVEEYGGGRLNRKHSSFFIAMLTELNMQTEPEAYFDVVPWQVLAAINHSFLLSERKRFYLRYVGGLLYTEISVPAGFDNYRAAAERLGMSQAARGYWEIHIKEDERHGQWMLHDVALPLTRRYPREAWELVMGYAQQKLISDRAGASIVQSVRAAECQEINNQSAA